MASQGSSDSSSDRSLLFKIFAAGIGCTVLIAGFVIFNAKAPTKLVATADKKQVTLLSQLKAQGLDTVVRQSEASDSPLQQSYCLKLLNFIGKQANERLKTANFTAIQQRRALEPTNTSYDKDYAAIVRAHLIKVDHQATKILQKALGLLSISADEFEAAVSVMLEDSKTAQFVYAAQRGALFPPEKADSYLGMVAMTYEQTAAAFESAKIAISLFQKEQSSLNASSQEDLSENELFLASEVARAKLADRIFKETNEEQDVLEVCLAHHMGTDKALTLRAAVESLLGAP